MLRAFREGPTRRPRAREWILDDVLVGVGALRVLRELLGESGAAGRPVRAWDLAIWCGVSRQGATSVLERLERCGLVEQARPPRRDRAATWRLVSDHPLCGPLLELFDAERRLARISGRRNVTLRTTGEPPGS